MLSNGEAIKRKDIEKALNISQSMAVKLLKSLLDLNIIIKYGKGKNIYIIN